jgi:hypothetical protein
MVNVLNFCWGTGAVGGPMILPALLARYGAGAIAFLLAPLMAAACLGISFDIAARIRGLGAWTGG